MPTQTQTIAGATYDTAAAARPEYGNMQDTPAPLAQFVHPVISDQPFFEDQQIAVEAYAANSGTDIAGGISYVDFWVGGTTHRVSSPVLFELPGYERDIPVGLYVINLPWASIPNGAIDIYATVVPSNPALATRVIGPLRVYRKAAWDKIIDITPSAVGDIVGSVYRNYETALAWYASNHASFPHTLCSFTENATITVDAHAGKAVTTSARGLCVVDGNGFTVTVKRSTWGLYRPNMNRLRFRRMRFDVQYIIQLYGENGYSPMTFENCEIFSTAGTFELPGTSAAGMGPPSNDNDGGRTARNQTFSRLDCAFLASWIHDVYTGDWSAIIKVGNLIERTCGDVGFMGSANSGGSSIYSRPAIMLANEIRDATPEPLRTPLNAIQLAYDGRAGSGTWNVGGTTNNVGTPTNGNVVANPRTLILKASGAGTVATYTASGTPGTGIYTCKDLVAAINADTATTGFSATLLDNSRRFSACGPESGAYGADKPVSEPFTTQLYPHSDLGQMSATTLSDNSYYSHNWGLATESQPLFPSIQTTGYSTCNCGYIQNCFNLAPDRVGISGLISQMSGAHRHMLIVGNTVPFQRFSQRRNVGAPATVDALTRIVANVFADGDYDGTSATINAHIHSNYTYDPSLFFSANLGTNYSGGSALSDYAEFTAPLTRSKATPKPVAAVRDVLVARQLPFDINGTARGSTAPAGAFA